MQLQQVQQQIAAVDSQGEQVFLAAQKSPDPTVRAQASQVHPIYEDVKKQREIVKFASDKLGQYYGLRQRALIGKIESLQRMEALVGTKEFETEMQRFARFVSDEQRLHRIARENIVNALAAIIAVSDDLDSCVGVIKTADIVSVKEARNDVKCLMGLLENINKELVDREIALSSQLTFVSTGVFGEVESVKKQIKAQKAILSRERQTLLDLAKRFQIAAQNQTAHLNRLLPSWYQVMRGNPGIMLALKVAGLTTAPLVAADSEPYLGPAWKYLMMFTVLVSVTGMLVVLFAEPEK